MRNSVAAGGGILLRPASAIAHSVTATWFVCRIEDWQYAGYFDQFDTPSGIEFGRDAIAGSELGFRVYVAAPEIANLPGGNTSLAGRTFHAKFLIESKVSGLRSIAVLRLWCSNGASPEASYISDNMTIVRGSTDNESLENVGDGFGDSLGWISSPIEPVARTHG